ncbi:FabD/lysophospholipase-like protein [Mycena albidolilacea]|uniref:FabD/lysophospholipase-like protein n=1 Tax=Mycena albidolilacea TaxID=1033008 RepID=A0AAD7EWL9_9AGAR|nr:FabD/lysophospholipase-like protein [Mycena albidolilacea]
MLIIIEHLMYRLKVQENLPTVPHPCDYFDLIGGTSTGGLIALMMGCLRMSVKDAVKAYGQLAKEVFSDVKSPGSARRFKASKLEKAIKGIVRASSASQDPEEKLEDIRDNACKMFVCAMNAANMSLSILLRTYNTPNHPAMDSFADGGMGYNNPTAALLLEAKVLFPDRQIACIISLSTGQPHTINVPKSSLLHRFIPLDIEHQSLAHRFDGVAKIYFHFNVEPGMQDIQLNNGCSSRDLILTQLNQWEKLGDIAANTRQYIQSQPVVTQLTDAVKSLLEKIGRVSTAGLSKTHFMLLLI